ECRKDPNGIASPPSRRDVNFCKKCRASVARFTHERANAADFCRMFDRCTTVVSEHAKGYATRRLAAILFAGYDRLSPEDDAADFTGLSLFRSEVIEPQVRKSSGNLIRWTGDSVLVEFDSIVEAVRCAAALREGVSRFNQALLPEQHVVVRIGINLDDIIAE